MTVPTLNAVGFCAHYSPQGDWAFDYALRLAKESSLQLNVFHFLADPYDPDDRTAEVLPRAELDSLAIERERELRLYYDERAGDYLNIGFRLCYDDSWVELHRCLLVRQFQLLVLGNPGLDAVFCRKPIEEYADAFVCPTVLVGPDDPQQFRLNSRAALLTDRLGIPEGWWSRIESCQPSR